MSDDPQHIPAAELKANEFQALYNRARHAYLNGDDKTFERLKHQMEHFDDDLFEQGVQTLIDDLLKQYREGLDRVVSDSPIGSFLCVHGNPILSPINSEVGQGFALHQDLHVVMSLEDCDFPGPKIVHGPKQ